MGSSSTTEELRVHWKDFQSNLVDSVCKMREDSDFFDVKIACFDNQSVMKTIPAHKMVLSACSPVFKELLYAIGAGDSKCPLLFLRGISYQEMNSILDFMYTGQSKIQHDKVDVFLATAEELKIKGLTEENQEKTCNSIRKRPFQHQKHKNIFENKGDIKPKIKKHKSSSPFINIGHENSFETHTNLKSEINIEAGHSSFSTEVPSLSENNVGNIAATKVEEEFEPESDNNEVEMDYSIDADNTFQDNFQDDLVHHTEPKHIVEKDLQEIGDFPHQPNYDYKFPKRPNHMRRFQHKWFFEFDWLHYNEAEDNVYCYYCIKCIKENYVGQKESKKSAWTHAGFNAWNKAKERFAKHQQSSEHHRSIMLCS